MSQEANTCDSRPTRFEVVSIHQYAHGRGGLMVECIERNTQGKTILEISTETMGPDLNAKLVDAFGKLEEVYADVFDAKASAATPETRHAAVQALEKTRQEHARLDQEIEAKRAELAQLKVG